MVSFQEGHCRQQQLSDAGEGKFQDNFANTAGTDSFKVTLFQLYAKDNSRHHISDAGASHTENLKNHICKFGHSILPGSEKLKSDQFSSILLKYFTRVEPIEVV